MNILAASSFFEFLKKDANMAAIKNIQGLTGSQIESEIRRGATFRVFPYAISIVIMTFNRSSDIYFVRAGEGTFKHSFSYIMMSLFLGWWGFPWGPIYTIGALYRNLSGGKDVTQEVLNTLGNAANANAGGYNVPNPSAGQQSGYNIPNSGQSNNSGYNVPCQGNLSSGTSNYNIR